MTVLFIFVILLPALNKLGASMSSGYESGMWYCVFGQIDSNTVEEPACSYLEDICRILPWWWTHAVSPKCMYQMVWWEIWFSYSTVTEESSFLVCNTVSMGE